MTMASAVRDRTAEFQSTVTLIKQRRTQTNKLNQNPNNNNNNNNINKRSEFTIIAKSIQNDVKSTYTKLG